jgi:hypothetical protein
MIAPSRRPETPSPRRGAGLFGASCVLSRVIVFPELRTQAAVEVRSPGDEPPP